jgi:RNA polymerase sigma-70 factor (ECF subfamily)
VGAKVALAIMTARKPTFFIVVTFTIHMTAPVIFLIHNFSRLSQVAMLRNSAANDALKSADRRCWLLRVGAKRERLCSSSGANLPTTSAYRMNLAQEEKGEPVIASHKLCSRSGVINHRFAMMTIYADSEWQTRKSWVQYVFPNRTEEILSPCMVTVRTVGVSILLIAIAFVPGIIDRSCWTRRTLFAHFSPFYIGGLMAPSPSQPERPLEDYREYLYLLARMEFDQRFQGKLDLSGVVQQTLLEAHQALGQRQGHGNGQKAAWLRKILANNLTDEVRRLGAASRDVAREVSLEAALDDSSCRLLACLAADQSSPSRKVIREEQLLRMADALSHLPNDQRRAIELHYLKACSLAQVAAEMGRSKGAVASLVFRGLAKLREMLEE